jgi:hypothetical protein
VQRLQFFLSEAPWGAAAVNRRRLELLWGVERLRPHGQDVLIVDDTGDRKAGNKTADVARRYLGSIGKIDNGIVAVTTVWADDQVYQYFVYSGAAGAEVRYTSFSVPDRIIPPVLANPLSTPTAPPARPPRSTEYQ